LGQKLVNDWNVGPNIRTRIDSVEYANHLHGLGVDVSNADTLLDETLCIFPQKVSDDRRGIFRDIFLGELGSNPEINWQYLWNCYIGTGFCPPGSLAQGDDTGIRPHLDILIVAVMAAHEFQLK